MLSVRTVYPDGSETRSTYSSLRGDATALLRALADADPFQGWIRTATPCEALCSCEDSEES